MSLVQPDCPGVVTGCQPIRGSRSASVAYRISSTDCKDIVRFGGLNSSFPIVAFTRLTIECSMIELVIGSRIELSFRDNLVFLGKDL